VVIKFYETFLFSISKNPPGKHLKTHLFKKKTHKKKVNQLNLTSREFLRTKHDSITIKPNDKFLSTNWTEMLKFSCKIIREICAKCHVKCERSYAKRWIIRFILGKSLGNVKMLRTSKNFVSSELSYCWSNITWKVLYLIN
jgi:uncharacterized lipoprotein